MMNNVENGFDMALEPRIPVGFLYAAVKMFTRGGYDDQWDSFNVFNVSDFTIADALAGVVGAR